MINYSKCFCLVTSLFIITKLFSQNQDYQSYVQKADSLFELKEYAAASEAYQNAFATIEGKAYPKDRYKLAQSFILLENQEKAFYHLQYLADKSIEYLDSEEIKSNPILSVLHEEEDWKSFVKKLDDYAADLVKDYNIELVNQLQEIYDEDQGVRNEYFQMREQYDRESTEMKNFTKGWRRTDSINEVAVTKILDEYGWLSKKIVSPKGNMALFLVIQHAPIETQLKYLPMMREAVKNGNANSANLALLEDRVALRQGDKQIYGSQIGGNPATSEQYLLPLLDPRNVDERRKSVGLGPLKEYMSRFGLEWNVEEYIKRLPEYEALQQKNNH